MVKTGENEWHTLPTKLMLKGDHPPDHYIESIHVTQLYILVLRSKQDGSDTWLEIYDLDGNRQQSGIGQLPQSPMIQGIAVGQQTLLYFSTGSYDGLRLPPGIYRQSNLVVPNICANGLAFCDDGSLLAAVYNDAGYIIRVPSRFFQES